MPHHRHTLHYEEQSFRNPSDTINDPRGQEQYNYSVLLGKPILANFVSTFLFKE